MEEKKDIEIDEETPKKVYFIQPHDCRIDVSWKFEIIDPEKNKNKEK